MTDIVILFTDNKVLYEKDVLGEIGEFWSEVLARKVDEEIMADYCAVSGSILNG